MPKNALGPKGSVQEALDELLVLVPVHGDTERGGHGEWMSGHANN